MRNSILFVNSYAQYCAYVLGSYSPKVSVSFTSASRQYILTCARRAVEAVEGSNLLFHFSMTRDPRTISSSGAGSALGMWYKIFTSTSAKDEVIIRDSLPQIPPITPGCNLWRSPVLYLHNELSRPTSCDRPPTPSESPTALFRHHLDRAMNSPEEKILFADNYSPADIEGECYN